MKPLTIFIAVILPLITAPAQDGGTIITSAPTIESGLSNLEVKLTRLLEEAEKQNEKSQKLLDYIGDPKDVTAPALAAIREDIVNAAIAAKTSADRDARLRSTTGAEAFGDKSYGLTAGVGATYTTKTGDVVERDPEKYKLDAALMKELETYETASLANEDRKAKLLDEYQKVMDQMSSAENLSTVMKYKGMLSVIATQIEECSAVSLKAKQDYDVVKEKLTVAERIRAKAAAEGRKFDRDSDKAAGRAALEEARAAAAAGTSTPGTLRWGPKSAAP